MKTLFLGENRFENGTLTATGTSSGYSVNNILDRRAYTKWKAAAHTTNYININHGGPTYAITTCAIFNHNFYSNSAVVTLECYDAYLLDWVNYGAFTITKDGSTSMHFASTTFGLQWRIKIVTSSGALPEFACALLGSAIEFPIGPDSPHTDFEEMPLKESGNSKTGNLLGSVYRGSEFYFSLTFSLLTRTFADANLLNNWWPNYGKTGLPFIYIPDYNYDDEEVYLVRTTDEYRYKTPKSMLAYYDSVQIDLVGARV